MNGPQYGYPAVFGDALRITLQDKTTQVRIYYQTTNASEAIQFLDPEQTKGKQLPFLFTQNQAIHARSMLPCQDTPSTKATYSATITTSDAKLVAVMSAVPTGSKQETDKYHYTFEQKVPIPVCEILLLC